MNRDWYDFFLLLLFMGFAYYKAARITGWNPVAISFRVYNFIVARVFPLCRRYHACAALAAPTSRKGFLSVGRAGMVGTIIWCIVEIELARETRWRYIVMTVSFRGLCPGAALFGMAFTGTHRAGLNTPSPAGN